MEVDQSAIMEAEPSKEQPSEVSTDTVSRKKENSEKIFNLIISNSFY